MSDFFASKPASGSVEERLEDGSLFDEAILESRQIRNLLDEPPKARAPFVFPRSQPALTYDCREPEIPARPDLSFDEPPAGDATPIEERDEWPWNGATASVKQPADLAETPPPQAAAPIDNGSIFTFDHARLHDESATEDVVLSAPPFPLEESLAEFAAQEDQDAPAAPACLDAAAVHDAPLNPDFDDQFAAWLEAPPVPPVARLQQDELSDVDEDQPAPGLAEVAAAFDAAGASLRPTPPQRIGSGRKVRTRLTWRPGDPFGDGDQSRLSRFRWDVMLTSAGMTVACGLGAVWLLRTIFA